MKKIFVIIGILAVCSMAQTMTDSRDGKTYKTVKIGDQVWMAENLNYSVPDSRCSEYDSKTCIPYGRVYSLKAAQNACPNGYRLPNKTDFEKLLNYVGKNSEERGWNLRKKGEFGGLDKFGFSAHLGTHYFSMGDYDGMRAVSFWSSSKCSPCVDEEMYLDRGVYHLYIDDGYAGVDVVDELELENATGIPIRCLRDLSNEEKKNDADQPVAEMSPPVSDNLLVDSRDGEVYRTVKIGDNEWMAENLRYKTPNSVCLMNNDEYCHLGRYYSLQEPQDWCPEGWHVPTLPEIACVVTKDGCVQIYEGQESLALTVAKTGDENLKVGTKLKINSGWKPAEGIATPTDDLVFSAMAVGFYDGNQFSDQGGGAYFWTSTSDRGSLMIATPEIHTLMGEANPSQAYYWYLYNDSEELGVNTGEKSKYFSIRCIKTKK